VRKRRDEFGDSLPYTRVFRTAMAPGSSTRSATACPGSAWGSGAGGMARSPTVLFDGCGRTIDGLIAKFCLVLQHSLVLRS
jgi:hypothetical protein